MSVPTTADINEVRPKAVIERSEVRDRSPGRSCPGTTPSSRCEVTIHARPLRRAVLAADPRARRRHGCCDGSPAGSTRCPAGSGSTSPTPPGRSAWARAPASHSMISRSIDRACQFGMAQRHGIDRVAVRTHLPPLSQRQLKRLPLALQTAHERGGGGTAGRPHRSPHRGHGSDRAHADPPADPSPATTDTTDIAHRGLNRRLCRASDHRSVIGRATDGTRQPICPWNSTR